jgi:hypothetical protein
MRTVMESQSDSVSGGPGRPVLTLIVCPNRLSPLLVILPGGA